MTHAIRWLHEAVRFDAVLAFSSSMGPYASEIDVPKGAGLIVRTAGAKRTKTEPVKPACLTANEARGHESSREIATISAASARAAA